MKIKLASVSEGTGGGDIGADVSPVKTGRLEREGNVIRLLAHLLTPPWLAS